MSELSIVNALLAGLKDNGPAWTLTRTYTQNDDISTARDITAAPGAGLKVTAVDIVISTDTDCYLTVQMETSANVLWGGYVTGNAPVQLTLRGLIKGDAANKKLQIKSSVAAKGACLCVWYAEA